MDSGTISQLVFFVFAAAILIYGFTLFRSLARVRDANDRLRAKLDVLLRDSTDPMRVAAEIESFNHDVRQYNARIGQFPEAIVAAIMGLQRHDFFSLSGKEGGRSAAPSEPD